MPRRAYLDDLLSVKTSSFGNISNVKTGDDDGEFTFTFQLATNKPAVKISALIPDLSEYPKSHDYHIFASEDAPASIAAALEHVPNLRGKPISTILPLLSRFLIDRTATGGRHDPFQLDSDGDIQTSDAQGDFDPSSDEENVENEDWALDLDDALESVSPPTGMSQPNTGSRATKDTPWVKRARADLRAVKAAGFKVGHLGHLQTGSSCYVSIACRIAKLGISEEAMGAWNLDPSKYLVLLLYYPSGYRPLDHLESIDAHAARQDLEMRTGISDSYKPLSIVEAHRAFKKKIDENDFPGLDVPSSTAGQFHQSFISRPLDDLLNTRFLAILKYRMNMGLTWAGAEKFFNQSQGMDKAQSNLLNMAYDIKEQVSTALPSIVTNDEIQMCNNYGTLSFPLIAMQFLLRHFVSCTSFCLVCHCKLDNQMEAIKPYVCDSNLCLYQYMSLGFGPSIEHEIITQPYVVDLLISFCYSTTRVSALNQFPEGLGLMVPHPALPVQQWSSSVVQSSAGRFMAPAVKDNIPLLPKSKETDVPLDTDVGRSFDAKIDQHKLELLFDQTVAGCPVRKGDWLVINIDVDNPAWHCRVLESIMFPTVRLSEPLQIDTSKKKVESLPVRHKGWRHTTLHVYSQNFDELSPMDRYTSIQLMLDLLPSVVEMKAYLDSNPGSSLTNWVDRISPAGLGLLRWIVASNRSMILQVDEAEGQDTMSKMKKSDLRVEGTPGWLQFRFAMGAPDKEQRFVNAIKEKTESANYPTIFAWHGSPLHNWHSIIRESLNFSKTSHGRAYGNGCYFAKDFVTSSGYASMHQVGSGRADGAWPQSILQISSALALSEIVNAPSQFVSQTPYYVVQHCDWIQTRYLFVQPCVKMRIEETTLSSVLRQDPSRTPSGSLGKHIVVPLAAIPRSRRPAHAGETGAVLPPTVPPVKKKTKLTTKALKGLDGDFACAQTTPSVTTDVEDREFLLDPIERPPTPPLSIRAKPNLKRKGPPPDPTTPFVPGTVEGLPTMPTPSYATSMATRRLQKDFRTLLATQESHITSGTLAELGWYVDAETVTNTNNLYQWIIELHSFPLTLPLAADLNKSDMQSVVLEVRFHASYPISPPFVRVIRPRFLPFQAGGGGHVTAGGSICMDLLTNSGWSAVSDIESVLLQIRMAIMSVDPRPARLEHVGKYGGKRMDYGVGEAVEAFKRACRAHGWVVPEGLEEVAFAGRDARG